MTCATKKEAWELYDTTTTTIMVSGGKEMTAILNCVGSMTVEGGSVFHCTTAIYLFRVSSYQAAEPHRGSERKKGILIVISRGMDLTIYESGGRGGCRRL